MFDYNISLHRQLHQPQMCLTFWSLKIIEDVLFYFFHFFIFVCGLL